MHSTRVAKSPKSTNGGNTGAPKEARITLSVCQCDNYEKIIFVFANMEYVLRILNISKIDLECAAVLAMYTGIPQVVARYRQRDIADTKFAQLEAGTPLIARSYRSFQLVDE